MGLRIYFLGFLFAGINIMLVAYFSAVDRAVPAITGSLMRGVIAIAISAVILSRLFGINGVWSSFLSSDHYLCRASCAGEGREEKRIKK